jgi:hypothetical protein
MAAPSRAENIIVSEKAACHFASVVGNLCCVRGVEVWWVTRVGACLWRGGGSMRRFIGVTPPRRPLKPRQQKDPMRALTDDERAELEGISRSHPMGTPAMTRSVSDRPSPSVTHRRATAVRVELPRSDQSGVRGGPSRVMSCLAKIAASVSRSAPLLAAGPSSS